VTEIRLLQNGTVVLVLKTDSDLEISDAIIFRAIRKFQVEAWCKALLKLLPRE
jgi:hypothetical protein